MMKQYKEQHINNVKMRILFLYKIIIGKEQLKTNSDSFVADIVNDLKTILKSDYLYVGFIFVVYLFFLYLQYGRFQRTSYFFENMTFFRILSFLSFSYLIFNVCFISVNSLYAKIIERKILPQKYHLSAYPKTAIIFTIRGELSGLFERIKYTLDNNDNPNFDLWILSGKSKNNVLAYEKEVVRRLKAETNTKIYYCHTNNEKIKKREALDIWLQQHSFEYEYFFICDADSYIPFRTIEKLILKAEHSANSKYSIFQAISFGNNLKSFFAYKQSMGIRNTYFLYLVPQFSLFQKTLFIGHNALVRVQDFKALPMPVGKLSHDIWDTVYLEQSGKSVALCPDVISYEEVPANYVEEIKRMKRWCRGNLETLPLIFAKRLSLGIRFQVFYGVYLYSTQIVFLLVFLSGALRMTMPMWFYFATFSASRYVVFLTVMIIIFFHRLLFFRDVKYLITTLTDILYSTVVFLNNIVYISIGIITTPFKGMEWTPMKKDPSATLSKKRIFITLLPSTAIGIVLMYMGLLYSPYWLLLSIPVVSSFSLGMIMTYLTAQPLKKELRY